MPGPVSHTATVNAPSVASARIATSPLSVNLMALPTRLSSTCESRRPSPCPVGRSGATSSSRTMARSTDRAVDQRVEHRLYVEFGAADYFEHVGSSRLLL